MAEAQPDMALSPDQLNPTDRAILDELRDGRVTPAYVADTHGYSSGNVRNRMTNLAQHGHARALGGGLYELVDDPRGGEEPAIDPQVSELRGEVQALEERVETLQAANERLRTDEGVDTAVLRDAYESVQTALRALDGQHPDTGLARSELDGAKARLQEVLGDE